MQLDELQFLLDKYSVRPSKGKGQNFLFNEKVVAQMVEAAKVTDKDCVLEVGPGFGILTEELLKSAKKVLAVELDKKLIFFLKQKFHGYKNLEILDSDILRIKNEQIVKLLNCFDSGYKVVANLPYAITKPILQKFLTFDPKPSVLVVLVQKEVAEKIVAQPGEMSILSLSVQLYGQPEIVSLVTKDNFYPQPKVDSAILKIKIWEQKFHPEIIKKFGSVDNFNEKKFWQLIKIGYSSPRKQLHNNLSAGFKLDSSEVKNILKTANLNEQIRAQDLALSDWLNLYPSLVVKN